MTFATILLTLLSFIGIWLFILGPFALITLAVQMARLPWWLSVIIIGIVLVLGISLEAWVIKGAVNGWIAAFRH